MHFCINMTKALHDVLQSVKHSRVVDEKAEIDSLRKLVRRIGSHRVEEKDTTSIIREMREKSYDI